MIRRAAALLAVLAVAAPHASAQERGSWSVEDSLEVRVRLDEADELLGKGLAGRAAPLLQEVLDRFPDHVVRDPADPERFEGARAVVMRRLRGLSPAARRAYEGAVGPAAEAALARGLAARDPEALRTCGERFVLAGDAGARALLAAADLHLARGEPGLAVAPLRLLLAERAGTPWAGPATASRLARALGKSGDRAGVLALRREREGDLGAAVRAGDAATSLGAVIDEALADAGPPPRPGDSPTLGGGPSRSGRGFAAEPLNRVRWTQGQGSRFRWSRKDEEQRGNESSVAAALEASQPVAAALVDGVLYAHHSYDLVARDLYTGTERWRFRVPSVPRSESSRTHGSILFCPTVAEGLVYAPLQVWPSGDVPRDIRFAGQDIIPHIPVRRLFAVDAGTGRPAWSHEDPRPAGDPFAGPLRYLNVTSAPLVVGDAVIAAGAAYDGVFSAWAFAADRRTGKVRWRTRIGMGQQELNLFGRVVKEVPVAAVASDGVRLFVQTNLGLVTCLDATGGQILWIRGYAQNEIPLYQNLWTTPERELSWTGSPPIATGDLVLAAPADGPALLAIHAHGPAAGRLAWTHPASDGPFRGPRMWRLLGTDAHRAFVAGTSVRALDLLTGKILWDRPFPGERFLERSAGRGVVADGKVYVPTNMGLLVLDAVRGEILRRDARPGADAERTGRAGGNLVTTEGAAALVRLDEIEGYYRDEDVRARAVALLKERPGSVDALVEAARIYLAADRPEEALPLLRRALDAGGALPPAEAEARGREVRAILVSAREGQARAHLRGRRAADARDAYLQAAGEAPDAADAAAVLVRGADALRRFGAPDAAASLLERVVERHADALLEGSEELLARDGGRCSAGAYALYLLAEWAPDPAAAVAHLQRIVEGPPADLLFGIAAREWARRSLEQLVRIHGEAIYAPFEAQARDALDRARAARDPEGLAVVAERWPNSAAARRAGVEAARVRLEAGDAAGAAGAARRILVADPGEEVGAEALWILAESLARAGKTASARAHFQRLARQHPEVLIPAGDGKERAAEAVARRLAAEDLRVRVDPKAPLAVDGPWKTLWHREGGSTPQLLLPAGEPVPGNRILLLTGSRLDSVDPRTAIPAWNRTHPAFPGRAVSAGGFLVFARETTAVGLDPASGEIVWSQELPGQVLDAASVDSLAILLCAGDDGQEESFLVALDPGSGEPVWPNSTFLPGGGTRLFPRQDALVVVAPLLLRAVNAADGSLRPYLVEVRRPNAPPAELVPSRAGPLLMRRDTALEARDAAGGAPLWTWRADEGSRILAAAAGDGAAVILDGRGTMIAIDAASGREAWRAPAGPARAFDPSATALLADERAAYFVTSDVPDRGGVRVEARDLRTGKPLWYAPLSRDPVLVELSSRGTVLLAKYLSAGGRAGASGVAVLDAASGRALDEFADARLGGESFEASIEAGVLAVSAARFLAIRGR